MAHRVRVKRIQEKKMRGEPVFALKRLLSAGRMGAETRLRSIFPYNTS